MDILVHNLRIIGPNVVHSSDRLAKLYNLVQFGPEGTDNPVLRIPN